MIYFDNCATTITKPKEVAQAMCDAMEQCGNPGRSFCAPSLHASRLLYDARAEVADFVALCDALQVAFTSGATESINLVLRGLVTAQDTVITTILEHNAVLRTLHAIGCKVKYIDCDDTGALKLDHLGSLVDAKTKYMICTQGSNVLGSIVDAAYLHRFCSDHGITLILDSAQAMGHVPVHADDADVICFSGHKALFGPMGTGGVITTKELAFRPKKTGGTGMDSFTRQQSANMPDVFEAGTLNIHGIAGLKEGVSFIRKTGLETIQRKETMLTTRFLSGLRNIAGITLYGPSAEKERLPICAINVKDMAAEDVLVRLWEKWGIATRAGAHCAPLVHERFGTAERGMVRFSFSWFNTEEEIDIAIRAVASITREN